MNRVNKEGNRIRMILPLLHLLASFLYERCIFIFHPEQRVVAAVPLSQNYSDDAERIVGYVLSKLFAALMIYLLWKLIFYVADHWKQSGTVRIFTGIFLVGTLVLCFVWPDSFLRSEDNLITYSYAVRFFPEYWHSAYSSILYGACMMTLPHPFAISLLQWLLAVFNLAYLFERIRLSPVLQGKGKWLAFTVLLVPDSYYLLTDAYRTEQYALCCMFLISLIVMDIIDQKSRTTKQQLAIMVLCAFLAVWRTEGVILGILCFIALITFGYHCRLKKTILLICGVLAAFVLISIPQKLGDAKYYGKDYSFINSFPTLQNVLNADGANLSYEGVEEDLKSLEQVTPVKVIQAFGMDGYRRYNVRSGYKDINQSGASPEAGAAYNKAYYRILLHNLPIYAKTQVVMVLQALKMRDYAYIEHSKVAVDDLPPWTYDAWEVGREDLKTVPGYSQWSQSALRSNIAGKIGKVRTTVADWLRKVYLQSLVLILAGLTEVWIFFREIIRSCKKKKACPGAAALAFVLLGQAAAIALVMPAGVLAYFHAYFYATWILDLVYLIYWRTTKKQAA